MAYTRPPPTVLTLWDDEALRRKGDAVVTFPREQSAELIDGVVGDALQDVAQIGFGVGAFDLGGADCAAEVGFDDVERGDRARACGDR
jgi:hypothetical protein